MIGNKARELSDDCKASDRRNAMLMEERVLELGDGRLLFVLAELPPLVGTSSMVEISQVPLDRAMAYLRRLSV